MKLWLGAVPVLAIGALGAVLVSAPPASADEERVVVSRPGTVFHKPGSADLRGRGHERTLGAAFAAGYAPCHLCYAPAAKSGRTSTGTLAGAASGSLTTTGGFAIVLSQGSVETPFGLKQGVGEQSGPRRAGGRDPYDDLATIRNPGAEQGAYGGTSP
ncbi:MAG: hypothetical protein ACRD5D_07085 [Candidatus Polarisedimenticolia bacterium]